MVKLAVLAMMVVALACLALTSAEPGYMEYKRQTYLPWRNAFLRWWHQHHRCYIKSHH